MGGVEPVEPYPLVKVYITIENHHVYWVNPLFLWTFSIAFCMFFLCLPGWGSNMSQIGDPRRPSAILSPPARWQQPSPSLKGRE